VQHRPVVVPLVSQGVDVGAVLEQDERRLHALGLAHRLHQRSQSRPVAAVRIGPESEQQLQELQVGHQVDLRPEEVALVGVGPVLQEHPGDLHVFVPDGEAQRFVALGRPGEILVGVGTVIDLGSGQEQQSHHFRVSATDWGHAGVRLGSGIVSPVLGGEVQGAVTALVDGVHVASSSQEELGGFVVSLPDGIVQRHQTLSHGFVHLKKTKSESGRAKTWWYLSSAGQKDADLVEGHHPDDGIGQFPLQRVGDALGRHCT
jgi:hypothetical protein